MQCKRLAFVISSLLLVAFVLTGCGRGGFVTVNGEKISRDDYNKRLERLSIGGKPAGQAVLEEMITSRIMEQLAEEKGVVPTEEQIEAKIELAKKEGNLAGMLQQQGMTLDEFKRDLRAQQAFRNIITKDVEVTDEEVRNAYEQTKETVFTKPERVQIGVIICKTEENIKRAHSQLENGADFSTVALNLSEDEITRPLGGRVGWIWRDMQGVPANLVENAFSLRVKDYSNPFMVRQDNLPDQWVIVQSMDKRPGSVLTFDEVKEQIREGIALDKGRRNVDMNEILEQALRDADINIKADRYKNLPELMLNQIKAAKGPSAEIAD